MDHGSGMMSEADMSKLEAAKLATFDGLFLTQMIQHHQGAIEMAKTEQTSGQNKDAVALAGRIIKDQTTEIAKMQGMLRS